MDERTHDLHAADHGGAGPETDGAINRQGEATARLSDYAAAAIAEAEALKEAARDLRARAARERTVDDAGGPSANGEAGPAERAEVQSLEARRAHQIAMHTAAQRLGQVIGNAIEISALLTWSPGNLTEVDRLVSVAAYNLDIFRQNLSTAQATATEVGLEQDTPRDPSDDLSSLYGATLERMRETQRQMGGLIALLESDVSNTPALVAMARSIDEALMFSNVTNRGLSLVLAELGLTR